MRSTRKSQREEGETFPIKAQMDDKSAIAIIPMPIDSDLK